MFHDGSFQTSQGYFKESCTTSICITPDTKSELKWWYWRRGAVSWKETLLKEGLICLLRGCITDGLKLWLASYSTLEAAVDGLMSSTCLHFCPLTRSKSTFYISLGNNPPRQLNLDLCCDFIYQEMTNSELLCYFFLSVCDRLEP